MPDGKDAAETQRDLGVLFPDVDVVVRDPDSGAELTLTVREFRLLDGLKAQAEARGLIAALAETSDLDRRRRAVAAAKGETPPVEQPDIGAAALDAVIGDHAEAWLALLARATDRDAEWIARLADNDAVSLANAMWTANGPFFVRRIVAQLVGQTEGNLLHSLASSLTSSTPATDATSGTSPDDSPSGKPS